MNLTAEVRLADRSPALVVGQLRDAGTGPHFQYAPAFLEQRIALSPFRLPLSPEVFPPGPRGLHRLRGLFFDALPDGWGLKVLHRRLESAGLAPAGVSPLVWLRALGRRGLGALTFHPVEPEEPGFPAATTLADLAAAAFAFDADDLEELKPALEAAGGSPGGARPKAIVAWHDDGTIASPFAPLAPGFRHVLVKFAAWSDPKDQPIVEAAYLAMAERAGLTTPRTRLHHLRSGAVALVQDRFDRVGEARLHVHSFAGLLEIDIRTDLVDYRDLVRVATALTQDFRQALAVWRLAAFNVAAHNRDDHARNVAFVLPPGGPWRLAPLFDLTFALGPGGHHTMTVEGESRAPAARQLLRLARHAGLEDHVARAELERVCAAVADWPAIAKEFGLRAARITQLAKRHGEMLHALRPPPRSNPPAEPA